MAKRRSIQFGPPPRSPLTGGLQFEPKPAPAAPTPPQTQTAPAPAARANDTAQQPNTGEALPEAA